MENAPQGMCRLLECGRTATHARPVPVLARLNEVFAEFLSDAPTIASLNAIGLRDLVLPPDEIVASLKKDRDTNRRIVEAAEITAD